MKYAVGQYKTYYEMHILPQFQYLSNIKTYQVVLSIEIVSVLDWGVNRGFQTAIKVYRGLHHSGFTSAIPSVGNTLGVRVAS